MVARRGLAGGLVIAALVFALVIGGRSAAARPGPPPRVFAFLSQVGGAELDHLLRYGSRINVIAPNWYTLQLPGGTLIGQPHPSVVALTAAAGAGLWPVVNAELGPAGLMVGAGIRGRIVNAIAAEAKARGYAGITLDIEQLPATQSPGFNGLVRDLAARLHAQGQRLAVYVPRRTSHAGDDDYDWSVLSRYADLLIASGYNEHSSTGAPGPVTTTVGFAQMLDYAAGISRFRVAPAIGAFGYSWPLNRRGAGELMSSIALDALRRESRVIARAVGGELTFRAGGRVVYYENAGALVARARAARAHGMRWLALFSLGREPDSFWARITTARQAAGQRQHR